MRRGRRFTIRVVLGAIAAGVLALVLAASAFATSSDKTYTGQVHGCDYTITLHTSSGAWDASTTNCTSLGIAASLTGTWVQDQVTIGHVSASIAFDGGTTLLDRDLDYTFKVPISLDEATNTAATAQQNVHDAVQQVLGYGEDELFQLAASEALQEATGIDPQGTLHDLLSKQTDFCSQYDGEKTAAASCIPNDCPSLDCFHAPVADEPTPGDSQDTDSDQEALCPFLNGIQDDVVFVCVPTYLAGDIDAGDRSLVILPGGALVSLDGTPKISSNVSIVSLGGIIAGDGLELDAPYVAFGAGIVELLGNLTINADNGASVGVVDMDTALGGLSGLVQDALDLDSWASTGEQATGDSLPSQLPSTGALNLPARIAARRIDVSAPGGFKLGATSKLTTKGLGGVGELFNGTPAPHGENDFAGGSHGGLGGWKLFDASGQFFDVFHSLGGRAPTFDDPFEPTQLGDGGGGDPGSGEGMPGGGAIQVDAHEGDAVIDGAVDVSGYDSGVCGICGDHGGSGAGGSAFITAHRLMGGGEVNADGGSFCDACGNVTGGSGGGGRIAVLSGADKDFTGSLHAHGGYDHHFTGLDPNDINQMRGTGGAGTVFTQNVVFDQNGDVDHGLGTWPEGTLTIDGGRPAGAYPPPDGTPVDDAWGDPQERLVVKGGATAYADNPDFGTIDVLDGGRLTTDPSDPSLMVHALAMHVDGPSRVDANGRGFSGGDASTSDGAGAGAPAQTPATLAAGGSHGGAGGNQASSGGAVQPGAHPGSTYDDPQAPSLAGGGGAAQPDGDDGNAGGGVVNVEVTGTLSLDGLIAADGEDGGGPTADDPSPFDRETAGGGAGGAVQVHAGQVGGSGRVRAAGGSVCLAGPPLLPGGAECGTPSGSGGGGGGGRVALIAGAACGWTGSLIAPGGTDQQAQDDDIAQTTGQDGSAYYPTPTGTCPAVTPPGTQDQALTQAPSPTTPTTTPPGTTSGAQQPTRAQVTLLLSAAVKAILARGRKGIGGGKPFKEKLPSPGPGKFTETVTTVPASKGAKPVTVAQASATLPQLPGKVSVTVKVTKKGRAVMRRSRRPTLIAHVTFRPRGGGAPISLSRKLKLK